MPAHGDLRLVAATSAALAAFALLAAGCSNHRPAPLAAPAPAADPVPGPEAAPARRPPPVAGEPRFSDIEGALSQGGWARGTAPQGTRSLTLDGKPVALARGGDFLIGFDRDSGPAARLAAVLADGRVVEQALAIAPRAWNIEHVAAPLRPRGLGDEAFRRRREGELARIAAARALDNTGATGWRQRFAWPARGRISGRFGAQRIYAGTPGSYHSGLDIAGGRGSLFVAPADGVVVLTASEPFTLEGRLLILDHGAGLNSAFVHCDQLLVGEGERVRQGQPIGRIGMTGRATGPHLHWSIKWRDARLDPLLFVGQAAPER